MAFTVSADGSSDPSARRTERKWHFDHEASALGLRHMRPPGVKVRANVATVITVHANMGIPNERQATSKSCLFIGNLDCSRLSEVAGGS